MASKQSTFGSRGPMYFGGLLLGLAVGVGFYHAKKAMMPTFHEQQDARAEAVIAPGDSIRFVYTEDPGYFLIPGLPTGAVLSKRNDDGSYAPITRLQYGELVDKAPAIGPITEEGRYNLAADFYICAQPGVADCTKLSVTQDIRVERNSPAGDLKIGVDLSQLAQDGLKAGVSGQDLDKSVDKDLDKDKDPDQGADKAE
jgi:hypothetical protein